MAAADPLQLTKHLSLEPAAAGTPRSGRCPLRLRTLTWIWGFAMGGFTLLLVSSASGLITLTETVSTFPENQQAASTGRTRSELTT